MIVAEGKRSREEDIYPMRSPPVNSPVSALPMEVPHFLNGDGAPGSFHKAG